MIKKILLRDQDEILLALGVQDRKLRALEKEFKIDAVVKYNEDGQGAELSLKGTHSRLDKALARLRKTLEMSGKMKTEEDPKDRIPFKDNIIFRPEHARPIEARTENQTKYIEAVFENDLLVVDYCQYDRVRIYDKPYRLINNKEYKLKPVYQININNYDILESSFFIICPVQYIINESPHPCRRYGHPPLRRNQLNPQTDGRNRRQADSLAHHENLLCPWVQ